MILTYFHLLIIFCLMLLLNTIFSLNLNIIVILKNKSVISILSYILYNRTNWLSINKVEYLLKINNLNRSCNKIYTSVDFPKVTIIFKISNQVENFYVAHIQCFRRLYFYVPKWYILSNIMYSNITQINNVFTKNLGIQLVIT